jgi:aryl-alcohol dehydrogenase-like predicted oxidoreductase
MLPLCADEQIGVIPWSPMARGRLTRDWDVSSHRSETDRVAKEMYSATDAADRIVAERVKQVAEARGIPRAQVALAWVLHNPVVTAPIIGASKNSHIDDAVAALKVKLTRDEITLLEEAYIPHAVVGFN